MSPAGWTDQQAIDALTTYLGTQEEWSGADALEVIADVLGFVRPHPGQSEFRERWAAEVPRPLPGDWDQAEEEDTASSVSRQHYIDTGRYLAASETGESA